MTAEENPTVPKMHPGLVLSRRYVLLSQIAVGGMGEVWKARDNQTQDLVAVKVLRSELAGQEQFLARLRAEANNARDLSHPNLCRVLDSGEDDSLGWVVMELVNGMPMTDLLSSSRTLSPQLILSILKQTALALQVVHDAKVVHRDIKPANIMIEGDGHVKLTDFGISRASDQTTLTQPGMVMGTAQYLSPEQAMGKPATPAGDLYALGIIAYEALVGRRPFTGSSQVEIAAAQVNEAVPQMPETIPKPLRDLVMQLLEKDPSLRPQSAAELAHSIDKLTAELSDSDEDLRPEKKLIRAELLIAAKSVYSQERFAEYSGQLPPSIQPRKNVSLPPVPKESGDTAPIGVVDEPASSPPEPDGEPSKLDSFMESGLNHNWANPKKMASSSASSFRKVLGNLRKGIVSVIDWLILGLNWNLPAQLRHLRRYPSWQHAVASYLLLFSIFFVLFLIIGSIVGSLTSVGQTVETLSVVIWSEDFSWLIHNVA